jgi:broad specificity phosphatase PhoE
MTRLILISHGQTQWNVEGRWQGQSDPPLNGEGIAQAHRLATDLKYMGIEVIYTSPLLRAYQTAQIVA